MQTTEITRNYFTQVNKALEIKGPGSDGGNGTMKVFKHQRLGPIEEQPVCSQVCVADSVSHNVKHLQVPFIWFCVLNSHKNSIVALWQLPLQLYTGFI